MEAVNAKPCQSSLLWRTAECYYQVAEFLLHIFLHEFHASNALLNNAGYTKARKEYFSFLAKPKNLARSQQQ
jgi:hypothetical protein